MVVAFKTLQMTLRLGLLGVESICQITFTTDPKRFEVDHCADRKRIKRFMEELWLTLPARYQKLYPKPTYVTILEPHEGKRGGGAACGWAHAHVLLPNPYPELNGMLPPADIKWLSDRGWELFGRVRWGWERTGVYQVATGDAGAYWKSKITGYYAKGAEQEFEWMMGKRLITYTDNLSSIDPKNIKARQQAAELRKRRENSLSIAQRKQLEVLQAKLHQAIADGNSKRERAMRHNLAKFEHDHAKWLQPKPSECRGPRKSHEERIASCGSEVLVWLNGKVAGNITGHFNDVVGRAIEDIPGIPDGYDCLNPKAKPIYRITYDGAHPDAWAVGFFNHRTRADDVPADVVSDLISTFGFRATTVQSPSLASNRVLAAGEGGRIGSLLLRAPAGSVACGVTRDGTSGCGGRSSGTLHALGLIASVVEDDLPGWVTESDCGLLPVWHGRDAITGRCEVDSRNGDEQGGGAAVAAVPPTLVNKGYYCQSGLFADGIPPPVV